MPGPGLQPDGPRLRDSESLMGALAVTVALAGTGSTQWQRRVLAAASQTLGVCESPKSRPKAEVPDRHARRVTIGNYLTLSVASSDPAVPKFSCGGSLEPR